MAALYDLKLEAGVFWSPYGPDWTDSAPGMLPLICAVMSVLAATHLTVLFYTSVCQCVY